MKFKPKSIQEESLLKADSTLFLFNYRLDYEYKDDFLDNRKFKKDSIPDYYSAIQINKAIPAVPYEVLEELYIPEQDNFFNDTEEQERYLITYKINNKTDLYNHLIFDAFVRTGHEEEVLEEGSTLTNRWFFGKKWRPAGTIKIAESCERNLSTKVQSLMPLEGAKILIRQWFTVDSGISNSNGYFSTGTIRGEARYIIQWERYHYSIRSGNFGQAELRGPLMKRQDWNKNIQGGSDEYYGHIHRAALHYYYKNIKGLRRPPENGSWKPQMKIGAFYENNININGDYRCAARFLGIFPSVRIYNPTSPSCEIYATTIHELAHASHFNMKKTDYKDSQKIVKESWARGVEWELTRMTYPLFTTWFARKKDGYSEPSSNYTGIVPDMIDGVSGYDQVSGYTIRQIEDALQGERTWNNWRDNIKNSDNNATKNNVDALFTYWN